ncbi:MAG: protein-L-isoaspartate O-methyltransferase [Bdellovibrionales bacterium]
MTALHQPVTSDYAIARRNMVDHQLRPNMVTDSRILEAMGRIPRELFVPSTHVGVAYMDENIQLISGRALMQPLVLARLLQAAEIKADDRVLELAPATGYSTLVLASLTSPIFCVEPDALLHEEAEKNIAAFVPGKATVLAGAPVEGCIVEAPFDVIFINGSVEFLPDFLFAQLNEGGRLVAIVRDHDPAGLMYSGQARVYRKKGGEISFVSLFEANAPLVPGFTAPHGFKF